MQVAVNGYTKKKAKGKAKAFFEHDRRNGFEGQCRNQSNGNRGKKGTRSENHRLAAGWGEP